MCPGSRCLFYPRKELFVNNQKPRTESLLAQRASEEMKRQFQLAHRSDPTPPVNRAEYIEHCGWKYRIACDMLKRQDPSKRLFIRHVMNGTELLGFAVAYFFEGQWWLGASVIHPRERHKFDRTIGHWQAVVASKPRQPGVRLVDVSFYSENPVTWTALMWLNGQIVLDVAEDALGAAPE